MYENVQKEIKFFNYDENVGMDLAMLRFLTNGELFDFLTKIEK